MKKQYTSMQQELAARRAAEGSGTSNGPSGQGTWHSKPAGGRKRGAKHRSTPTHAQVSPVGFSKSDRSTKPRSAAEALRVRISDVEDLTDAKVLKAEKTSKDRSRKKTSPAAIGLIIVFCFFLVGMIVDMTQDMEYDDDWDGRWAATTDYGIDEDSEDLEVRDYLRDTTYSPDDIDVDQEALTKWLEDADSLLADAPGFHTITGLDNRILIDALYDPDEDDQSEVASYWQDAYYKIFDSLQEQDLDSLPVCVVLRDSDALQLRGIFVDGGTNFDFYD